MDGVSAETLVSDEVLAEIRLAYSSHADMQLLLRELDRLKAHNDYLTEMFYGVASLKLCKRHNAISIVDRVRERITGSWCQDCLADENERLRAALDGRCLVLTPEERDLILLVRAEQAKRDAQPPNEDMDESADVPSAARAVLQATR